MTDNETYWNADRARRERSMGCAKWNLAMLGAVGLMWTASSTQDEKAILSVADLRGLHVLESAAAAQPENAELTHRLAKTYLDARASGLAVRTIESAPIDVRTRPEVAHLFARALIEQGRAREALAVERSVHRECLTFEHSCTPWLFASVTRRVDILKELVERGVEDAEHDPEASLLAYQHATRQVGFIAQ